MLLYGFGAWMFFNGLQDLITNASKASKPPPSASPFDMGSMKPGIVCTAKYPGGIGEIDSDAPSHDEPSVTEIAKAERLKIELEHRSEYFYVVAEEENEEVVGESEHVGVFQAN